MNAGGEGESLASSRVVFFVIARGAVSVPKKTSDKVYKKNEIRQ